MCRISRTGTGAVADCIISVGLVLGQKWTVDCVVSVGLILGQ